MLGVATHTRDNSCSGEPAHFAPRARERRADCNVPVPARRRGIAVYLLRRPHRQTDRQDPLALLAAISGRTITS